MSNPIRAKLVKKWESAEGKMSLKGIKDPYLKENLAQLLENQEMKDFNGQEVFSEAAQGEVTLAQLGGAGQTYSQYPGAGTFAADADAYRFRPVALALVRRTFPDLFANKCCAVQALSTPVGLAYALRVIYEGTGIEAGWQSVDNYAGYTGSQVGTSAGLQGFYNNSAGDTGIYDSSGAGARTSAAETWTLDTAGVTATSTSTSALMRK